MIHQYNSTYSEPKYFIDNDEAYNILLDREIRRVKEDLNYIKTLKDIKKEFRKKQF